MDGRARLITAPSRNATNETRIATRSTRWARLTATAYYRAATEATDRLGSPSAAPTPATGRASRAGPTPPGPAADRSLLRQAPAVPGRQHPDDGGHDDADDPRDPDRDIEQEEGHEQAAADPHRDRVVRPDVHHRDRHVEH